MYCPNCGKELNGTENFCPNCAHQIKDNTVQLSDTDRKIIANIGQVAVINAMINLLDL